MHQHSVSVVIPAYRAAHTICRAVDSVLAQTAPAHEIVVVDDGSPDDIAAAIRHYGEKVRYLRKTNGGAASARNAGIDAATGDFIAFLDADDYWEPDKLERQLAIFERHPELGLVAGRFYNETPTGERTDERIPPDHWCDRILRVTGPGAFWIASLVWTGAVLVRRTVLAEHRFFPGLATGEDRDLWVRLAAAAPVYLTSQPLAVAVLEPGSLSRSNPDQDCANMMRVIERNRKELGFWATRQWISHTYFRWSVGGESAAAALRRIIQSLIVWPLPFMALEDYPVRTLPRLQRLAVLTRAVLLGGNWNGESQPPVPELR